ncbi:MAG: hypothetical protein K0S47_173 [Herbinix sp.]|nr:hypothetical protein [Herbinix sp.]
MDMVIKRLSPELINDYLEFFDHIAFADNLEWAGCYCVWYHWHEGLDAERKEYEAAGGTCFKRELAIKYIQKGILQGYLAYVDGAVVGWCNANDKTSYVGFNKEKRPELWEKEDIGKVKSIVCFTIAPSMRRKGITTQLLSRVCEDAFSEGYSCVEAYPGTGVTHERSYHGPLIIYEKCGFVVHKDLGGEAVMRKYNPVCKVDVDI